MPELFLAPYFGSDKSGDITTLWRGLQVYESMSQTFILCKLGMNHSTFGVPKGRMHKNAGKLK